MKPYFDDGTVQLYLGDCRDVLPELPDASIDAICTDPPYEIGFMGRGWDATGIAYDTAMWQHCWRVLKPGGHLLAFGATRTYHRLAVAIEDAGFEIRDFVDWIYGGVFPKSLNVSKAIDARAGAERQVVGIKPGHQEFSGRSTTGHRISSAGHDGWSRPWAGGDDAEKYHLETAPATAEASAWNGWATALKPAHEPIVVARKPLVGTVAANVLEHGTGAINVDACRIPVADATYASNAAGDRGHADNRTRKADFRQTAGSANDLGRWPTNVVFSHAPNCGEQCADGCPVADLDAQTGTLTSGANPTRRSSDKFRNAYGDFAGERECTPARGANSGGASRFFPVFRYEGKASAAERPSLDDGTTHSTVKPLDLMRWLVRLVCPPGGTVLDAFVGSGTTLEACVVEGFHGIGIEQHQPYADLCVKRLSKPIQAVLGFEEAS